MIPVLLKLSELGVVSGFSIDNNKRELMPNF